MPGALKRSGVPPFDKRAERGHRSGRLNSWEPANVTHIPEKHRFIDDLSPGMEVADLFLLATAQQAQAKNGPFWKLELRDARGSIGGKIWSPHSRNYPELSPGMAVVQGRVTSYRDQPEIAVESIRLLTDAESAGLDLSLFMPASARPPRDMFEELRALAGSVLTHEPWRRFAFAVLEHPEIGPAFQAAPAAKAMHHAFAGGLLEHTLSVCGLCMRLCDHYPALDRQALFTGALCHDLGKIWELSIGLVPDYTTKGRLIGHISLVLAELDPLMREAGLEPEAADHLRHLILSHHGTREFGSPVLPATAEALALHYADNLDAKLNQIEATLASALGDADSGWSGYVPALERTLFRAPKTPAGPEIPKPEAPSGTDAPSPEDDDPFLFEEAAPVEEVAPLPEADEPPFPLDEEPPFFADEPVFRVDDAVFPADEELPPPVEETPTSPGSAEEAPAPFDTLPPETLDIQGTPPEAEAPEFPEFASGASGEPADEDAPPAAPEPEAAAAPKPGKKPAKAVAKPLPLFE